MSKRIDNFDYLRIIGSILIVFYHYEMAYHSMYGNKLVFYGDSFRVEYVVELFFILSGFLTARRRNNKRFISAMLVKWVRVYPIALMSIMVSFLSLLLRVLFTPLPFPEYPSGSIIASILLVHQGWIVTYDYAINTPTWYLCVLLMCYILYYLIDSLDRKISLGAARGLLYFFIMVLAVAVHRYELPFLKIKSCRGYLAFFAGVVVCELFKTISSRRLVVYGSLLASAGTVLIYISRVSFFWESLASVIMFGGIVMVIGNIRQFPNRVARRLGSSSFEVFLFHVPVIELSNIIVYILKLSYTRSVISMTVLLTAVEIMAVYINKYIEIPLNRKIRKKLDDHKIIRYYSDVAV